VVTETRTCEQCGTSFVPRREHARFCSPSCRAAWNHEHTGDLKAGTSALQWSVTAMSDTTRRLSQATAWNQAQAFAVITEAVWWVTIVDATLVRHHLEAYDAVVAGQAPAERQLVEGTLAGLRFIRNRIGDEADLADFIEPSEPASGSANGHITGWTWRPVPEPAPASIAPRGQPWEIARYRAYQAQLADHAIGATFTRAEAFLKVAANTPTLTDTATGHTPR
jgi:hypothetical protein